MITATFTHCFRHGYFKEHWWGPEHFAACYSSFQRESTSFGASKRASLCCRELKHLAVTGPRQSIGALAEFPARGIFLDTLELYGFTITRDVMAALSRLTSLKSLTLSGVHQPSHTFAVNPHEARWHDRTIKKRAKRSCRGCEHSSRFTFCLCKLWVWTVRNQGLLKCNSRPSSAAGCVLHQPTIPHLAALTQLTHLDFEGSLLSTAVSLCCEAYLAIDLAVQIKLRS